MRNVQNILFPTDFSSNSRAAQPAAVTLAKRFGATLHLLHIVPPMTAPALQTIESAGIRTIDEDFRKDGDAKLREYAAEIGDDVNIECHVLAGTPGDAIERFVIEKKVDLVTLATQGHTGLDHFMLGSTAEKVIRSVPCPVLVCRNKPASWESFGTILLPTALGELAKLAIAEAVELAKGASANLHLLHVLEEAAQPMHHVLKGHGLLNIQDQARRTVEMQLLALKEQEVGDAVPATYEVREGSASTTVATVADEKNADLIVLGTHAREGLAHFVLGSTAERIARIAPCSVLVVKRRDG